MSVRFESICQNCSSSIAVSICVCFLNYQPSTCPSCVPWLCLLYRRACQQMDLLSNMLFFLTSIVASRSHQDSPVDSPPGPMAHDTPWRSAKVSVNNPANMTRHIKTPQNFTIKTRKKLWQIMTCKSKCVRWSTDICWYRCPTSVDIDVCGSGVANSCRSMGLCWSGAVSLAEGPKPPTGWFVQPPTGRISPAPCCTFPRKQLGGSRLDLLELASNQIWWSLKRQTQFRNSTRDTFEKLVMETCWNLNLQACCCLCVCVCVVVDNYRNSLTRFYRLSWKE